MRTDTKRLIGCVAIPLLVGGLAAFLTMEGMEYYKEEVTKPALTPPPWVFSVVWTILYVVMGYASFLVVEEVTGDQKTARILYFAQLFFNFCNCFLTFCKKKTLILSVFLYRLAVVFHSTCYNFVNF